MKKFFSEFKTFAMRGNVMDMAIGVVIGAAFGKITTSIVNDIIMPLIGLLTGGIDLSLGAATSIGGVVCGKALKAGCSIPVAILLALAVGLLIGLMNGVCIVKFKLPGFILTLGTQYLSLIHI